MQSFNHKLYLVTDERACRGRDLLWVVEQAVKGGVDVVQLREKNMQLSAFIDRAYDLKVLLDKYNVPLIINDNLPVAMQVKAQGIHVGNNDMSPLDIRERWPGPGIVGYSIEYETQVESTEAMVSDYLALSPVFATVTKTDTVTEWGLKGIQRIRSLTTKPLVAIGNINIANARSILWAGADCLAVVSAICSAEQPAQAAELLRKEIETKR